MSKEEKNEKGGWTHKQSMPASGSAQRPSKSGDSKGGNSGGSGGKDSGTKK